MATYHKTLQLIASKLGMAGEDKVIRKAAEFERLLQTKTTNGINMSDTSKVVICLDLAAFILGVDMDIKTAIKYSGLKSSIYTSSRKVVENLLELNNHKLTVPGICLKLQCSVVQALAANILEEYQRQAKMEVDLNLPQYVCMAVYQACRLKKVKVSKSKLLETSRLRPAQWSKLETDWTKFVDEHFAAVKKKRGCSVKSTVVNEEMEIDKPPKEELCSEPPTESYEDWKKRMLESAYKELREMEELEKKKMKKQKVEKTEDRRSPRKHNQSQSPRKNSQLLLPRKSQDSPRNLSQCLKENELSPRKDVILSPMQEDVSPRRSPRKTPQKFAPYKSPNCRNGVRLLFPKNL